MLQTMIMLTIFCLLSFVLGLNNTTLTSNREKTMIPHFTYYQSMVLLTNKQEWTVKRFSPTFGKKVFEYFHLQHVVEGDKEKWKQVRKFNCLVGSFRESKNDGLLRLPLENGLNGQKNVAYDYITDDDCLLKKCQDGACSGEMEYCTGKDNGNICMVENYHCESLGEDYDPRGFPFNGTYCKNDAECAIGDPLNKYISKCLLFEKSLSYIAESEKVGLCCYQNVTSLLCHDDVTYASEQQPCSNVNWNRDVGQSSDNGVCDHDKKAVCRFGRCCPKSYATYGTTEYAIDRFVTNSTCSFDVPVPEREKHSVCHFSTQLNRSVFVRLGAKDIFGYASVDSCYINKDCEGGYCGRDRFGKRICFDNFNNEYERLIETNPFWIQQIGIWGTLFFGHLTWMVHCKIVYYIDLEKNVSEAKKRS